MPNSAITKAAIERLKASHGGFEDKLWALSSGKIVGELAHTPKGTWNTMEDPEEGHSDWFTETIARLIASTEEWCDFMSLTPPKDEETKFWDCLSKPLVEVAERSKNSEKKIVVRYLFGNIPTMALDTNYIVQKLTKYIPDLAASNLQVYVGAWRDGLTSWNHSKIVAVDGKRLLTGGHNPWDKAYLYDAPVHDTSIEVEGDITVSAHQYADNEWKFIQENLTGWWQWKWVEDFLTYWYKKRLLKRMSIASLPSSAPRFPSSFETSIETTKGQSSSDNVPILALGRSSDSRGTSADDAFVAMFDAANDSIRLFLQDLGPVTFAGVGPYGWPREYFKSWAKGMHERNISIEIILSNPGSDAHGGYSNGYSLEQVAAEIMKTMKNMYPEIKDDQLHETAEKYLKITFLKNKFGDTWKTGDKVGLHSKVFFIDDKCVYIGSQNLYICDLAEWGIVIDDETETAKLLHELWTPAASSSFPDDGACCDFNIVMDIIDDDREPDHEKELTPRELARLITHISDDEAKVNHCFLDDTDECCELHANKK